MSNISVRRRLVATVFGSTGFLGRYVVNKLARQGIQVVVPYRGEQKASNHLKVMGEVGQIIPVPFSIRERESISQAILHSNIVINLISSAFPTRNFTLEEANVGSARIIAEEIAKKDSGIRFIQASSVNADENSTVSAFSRTKGKMERVVREIYPQTTIIRSTFFCGIEDHFLNKFGILTSYPIFPLLVPGETKIQPLYVQDLAKVYELILNDRSTEGLTFEIGGPEELTINSFLEGIVFPLVEKKPYVIRIPFNHAKKIARYLQLTRVPQYTEAEVEYFQLDNIVRPSRTIFTSKNFKNLELTPLSEYALNILRLYRKPTRFDDPIKN